MLAAHKAVGSRPAPRKKRGGGGGSLEGLSLILHLILTNSTRTPALHKERELSSGLTQASLGWLRVHWKPHGVHLCPQFGDLTDSLSIG